jgi:hypothetical protein
MALIPASTAARSGAWTISTAPTRTGKTMFSLRLLAFLSMNMPR